MTLHRGVPAPTDLGTDRRPSGDDIWQLGLVVGCGVALVVGCIALTTAVRDFPGDTGLVVAAIRAGTGAVLGVGLTCVAAARRRSGRRLTELTRTKERFRAVYGASPAGIVETDLQQRILHCNAAFGAMLGLGAEDILGHHGWEFFHPDSPPPDVEAMQDMIAGVRSSYSVVRRLRAPDGSPLTVKLDWAAMADTSGAVTQLACVVTDLSEQARTAAEVVRARERAEALWRQASIGVMEATPAGVITSVNDAFATLLGHRPEDLIGRTVSALTDPEHAPEIDAGIARLAAGGKDYAVESRFLRGDGRSLPVLISTAVMHDEHGAVERLAGFVVDMSDLHAQRAALTAVRDELTRRQSFTDALLETLDVGIVSCATDGTLLSRNRAQREMLGIGQGDSAATFEENTAVLEVLALDGSVVAAADYPLQSALHGGGPSLHELLMGPHGGPHRQLVVRTSCITAPDGTQLGAVSALTDVTAERHAARQLAEESNRLLEAQRLGQLGSFTLDVPTGRFLLSEEIYRIWGLPPDTDLAAIWIDLVHTDDRVAVSQVWKAALSAGGRHASSYRITRSDGSVRHLRVDLDVQLGPDGSAIQVRGTHLDVTDLQVAHLAAAEASALVSAVLIATPDFTFVTDLATGAVVYAPPGKDILGITSEDFMAHGSGAIAALVHPEDHSRLRAVNVTAADLEDEEVIQLRYRALHSDGSWRWLSRRVTPFRRNAEGVVIQTLGVVRDVTDTVEAESRLQHSALHDPLTGLPNRALLMDRLEAALGRATQTGREAAVLFCDLDGFKRVNDTAGHAAGDAVLVETTRRMRAVVREQDTIARVGGDEFVVIVEPWKREPGTGPLDGTTEALVTDRSLAVELAERLTSALRQPVTVDGVEYVVTTSIGITYAGAVAVADDVLRDADAAMYRAKHGGKDRFEIFEHGLRADLAERGRVERLLRRAVAPTVVPAPRRTPTLAAAYQPVVDAGTGALVGFEALARLIDGQGGTIPPDVFIPVAESTALIRPLGMLMLDQACRQLAHWRRTFPGMANVTMAVNVSALQAQHASLLDDVRGTLRNHELAPTDLVLELTESSLLQAGPSTLIALRTLREDGVGIAIDDFGTGFASLSYLVSLPVSAVKVDRSFTAGLPYDQTCRTIVRAVVGLAADLNLTCIVEGVETLEQRMALPPGVQLQGWLTGRPVFEPDVAALLA